MIILPESLSLSARMQELKRADYSETDEGFSFSSEDLFEDGLEESLASIEKRMILEALERAGHSKMKAAELLKISFRSFRYKVKKYQID